MGKTDRLTELEKRILLTLTSIDADAYGIEIREELRKHFRMSVSIGGLYATLDRLSEKGFISSRLGDPLPERGGRARRYYRVLALGVRAANEIRTSMARALENLQPAEVR